MGLIGKCTMKEKPKKIKSNKTTGCIAAARVVGKTLCNALIRILEILGKSHPYYHVYGQRCNKNKTQ